MTHLPHIGQNKNLLYSTKTVALPTFPCSLAGTISKKLNEQILGKFQE